MKAVRRAPDETPFAILRRGGEGALAAIGAGG